MSDPEPRRRASIHDVARKAGVSTTTVSHAINGKGRVDKATRERIVKIAGELKYRANQNAINLLKNRSGILAMTVGAAEGSPVGMGDMEFFVRFVNAATSTALGRGFALVLIPSTKAEALAGFEIDGAIVIDPVADDPVTKELGMRSIPVVTSGRDPAVQQDSWIDNNLPQYTGLLLDHLAERGAERIGMVAPPILYSYSMDYRQGYLDWCERNGREPLISEAENRLTEKAGHAAAVELLTADRRPDAIFAGLDRHALGTLLAAESLGIDVPGELLIASGIDSLQMSGARPAITALALHPELSGEKAVESLLARIENPEMVLEPVMVETDLIVRESTGE